MDETVIMQRGLFSLVTVTLIVVFIWQRRRQVANLIRGGVPGDEAKASAVAGVRLRTQLADVWHILATIYVRLATDVTLTDVRACLERRYADEPFVHLVAEGVSPATRDVRGSNHCLIGVFADRLAGRAILLTAIDNLVKGASGQALQNMNLMCGLAETAGLEQLALFP